MTDLHRKRQIAKDLLREGSDKARTDGRPALANTLYGRSISVDAGRYDGRLDDFIAELRAG